MSFVEKKQKEEDKDKDKEFSHDFCLFYSFFFPRRCDDLIYFLHKLQAVSTVMSQAKITVIKIASNLMIFTANNASRV